jgi:uncharacterized membrane protein
MHLIKATIYLLVFIAVVTSAAPVFARTYLIEPKVVRAVMIWSQGCPHCHEVLENVLPTIQEQYGNQLEVLLIEVGTLEDIEQLFQVAESLGVSRDKVLIPFLIVGREVLIGSSQIPARFPGLIDDYLAQGGQDYPDVPGLAQMLPLGVRFASYQVGQPEPQESADSSFSGMTLAAVIMAFMLIALVVVFAVFLRAYQGKSTPSFPRWQDLAIPVLSLLGLGVAAYLTYVEVSTANAICGPVGDCNAVQNSPYAKLFGVLSVGILGAVGYIAILSTWLLMHFRSGRLSDIAPIALFGMSFFGTLYSIYLTYLELFVIKAVCLWCLSSAVIITLLMLFSLSPASAWVVEGDEDE